jgi:hypothetical protein
MPAPELYLALGQSIHLASKPGEASCCAGLRLLRASSWRLPQFQPKEWPEAEEVASVEGVASTEAEGWVASTEAQEWVASTEAEEWAASTEAEEWVAFMRAAWATSAEPLDWLTEALSAVALPTVVLPTEASSAAALVTEPLLTVALLTEALSAVALPTEALLIAALLTVVLPAVGLFMTALADASRSLVPPSALD